MGVFKKIGLFVESLVSAVGGTLSFFFVAKAIQDLQAPQNTTPRSTLIGLLVFFLLVGTGSLVPFAKVLKRLHRQKKEQAESLEVSILRAAALNEGKVTAIEIAAHCGLPVATVEAGVHTLARRDLCRMEITGGGTLVYVFQDFLSDGERQNSKDLLQ